MIFMEEKARFFDAHTHVQFSGFDADRDAVMQRAEAAGVHMINVGTQRDTSAAAIALAEKYAGAYAAIGLHPVHTSKSFHDAQELGGGDAAKSFTSRGEIFDMEKYRVLALHPKVVAIGECGLDYFRFSDDESREEQIKKQKAAFVAQLELARAVQKPIMIHCRNAFADVIEMLKREPAGAKAGVIHFFTGTTEDARQLLGLGFSFTFGGVVTFARNYDDAIKLIPLDCILSETDAPYVAPAPYRGKRNEPAYVTEVVKKLAELKGVPQEKMAAQILENARRIFSI
jgi:TatD DNase family protein